MLDPFIEQPALAAALAAVLVVLIGGLIVWLVARRRRSQRLERRFGAEYQRTVDDSSSRRDAERRLEARRREREQLDLHPLRPVEREELRARFEELQASFVDVPEESLRAAHHLIAEAAALRGYRAAEGSSRLEMVSADHPAEVAVHERNLARLEGTERVGTEELRQSLLVARRLFETIVRAGEEADPDAPRPPRTLLGLHDEDSDENGVEETTGEPDSPAGHRGPREADIIGEASARTTSGRSDTNGVPAARTPADESSRRRRAHQ